MSFVLGKQPKDWGVYHNSQAVSGALFPKILHKREFYSVRSSKAGTGHDWLGGQGFPGKASRFCFLGSGELAKAELEDCDWCMLHFLHKVSHKYGLT